MPGLTCPICGSEMSTGGCPNKYDIRHLLGSDTFTISPNPQSDIDYWRARAEHAEAQIKPYFSLKGKTAYYDDLEHAQSGILVDFYSSANEGVFALVWLENGRFALWSFGSIFVERNK